MTDLERSTVKAVRLSQCQRQCSGEGPVCSCTDAHRPSARQLKTAPELPVVPTWTKGPASGEKELCCPGRGRERIVSVLLPVCQIAHTVISANRPEDPSPAGLRGGRGLQSHRLWDPGHEV
ncbi:hypothetical protein Q5P01_022155 [Channa striata]|uniref:Uncharacterized protein n=1 Tax=Channa striata TaxID=64152 RepID=A0AA88LRB4_CHASR|nr:hypothetical protein Q5P01_022155 [Channa striata]